MSAPVCNDLDDGAACTAVVALDGPSGTGKSTVARELARRLGYGYLDTGAMYRAATLAVLRAGVDTAVAADVAAVVSHAQIRVGLSVEEESTVLAGEDVSVEIRGREVTAAVSAVSAVAAVREQLVTAQRELITHGPVVVEGRDIASVVWPDADPKIYLTASEQVRAQRRSDQDGVSALSLTDVAADLARRDQLDSTRAESPLRQVDDAIVVDTSDLSIDEVIQLLVDICMTKHAGKKISALQMK